MRWRAGKLEGCWWDVLRPWELRSFGGDPGHVRGPPWEQFSELQQAIRIDLSLEYLECKCIGFLSDTIHGRVLGENDLMRTVLI